LFRIPFIIISSIFKFSNPLGFETQKLHLETFYHTQPIFSKAFKKDGSEICNIDNIKEID